MKRKNLYILLLVLLILLVLIYIRYMPDSEQKLRIGYDTTSIIDGPIIIAYETGIFNKYSIKIEPISARSGAEIAQGLASGQMDLGSTGPIDLFIPISKGAPIQIIAPSAVSPTLLFVNPEKNIKTFEDLIDRKIGARIGSISTFALGYVLLKENISLESVELINIDSTNRPIALMEKKIVDAAVAGQDDKKTYSNYGAVVLEEWESEGYSNKAFPRTNIAVNTNFMNKNKKAINSFIDAFIEAQKFIKENPDESARIITKHIKERTDGVNDFSIEEIKDSWKGTKYTLWYNPQDLVEISRVATEIGDLKAPLDSDQFFDLSFEEKLKNAQEEIYPAD